MRCHGNGDVPCAPSLFPNSVFFSFPNGVWERGETHFGNEGKELPTRAREKFSGSRFKLGLETTCHPLLHFPISPRHRIPASPYHRFSASPVDATFIAMSFLLFSKITSIFRGEITLLTTPNPNWGWISKAPSP